MPTSAEAAPAERQASSVNPDPHALPPDVAARTLSPALVVHLDRVRENLRRVLALTGGPDRWRPHVKTTKIPAVFAELARAGLRHFKCATTRELDCLASTLEAEAVEDPDVLLAYPLVGPALERLGQLARAHRFVRISVLCEDPTLVPEIPHEVEIFVDVNPGMHRTGIPIEDERAIHAVARAAGDRFRGVHAYEGHLHHGMPEERRRATDVVYDRVAELLTSLTRAGLPAGELVTSGTPAFLHALAYPPFADLEPTRHRVSPGTVVYHDTRTEQENPNLPLVPAATIFTRVISHPAPNLVTCDAGSKSLAAEAGDPAARVLGHPELVAQTPNEEHLPLRVERGERPARGTELALFPRHVCPTINLAEEALLLDGGELVDVVSVAARAHETLLGPSGE